jgi:hypothetical protein
LEKIPELVDRLQAMLERFLQVVRCVDVSCLDERTWDELPTPSQVGKARVAGLAAKVREICDWSPEQYQARHASYDLKKLRGKNLIRQNGRRYYETSADSLQKITALAILQDKVIKPVLAKASNAKSRKTPALASPIEAHYAAVQKEIAALCQALGLKIAA